MIDPTKLEPGRRAWDGDIGARKALDGKVTWYIRYAIGNGRRKVETVKHARNRRQAQGALDTRKAEVFQGTWQPAKRQITVRQFEPEFIAAKAGMAVQKKYRQQMRDYVLPAIGSVTLDAVTISDVEALARKLRDGGLSESSVLHVLRCLQSMFREARKRRLTTNDPVRDAETPRPEAQRKEDILERVAVVMEDASRGDPDDMTDLFWILYHTGVRIAHARRMRWTDFDFADGIVFGVPDKRGKPVTIPIHPQLADVLAARRARQKKATPWVMASWKSPRKPRSLRRMQDDWNAWMHALGVELTRHEMRHAFITRMDAAGATEAQIQEMTGQKTKPVVRRYTHVQIETLRKLMSKA